MTSNRTRPGDGPADRREPPCPAVRERGQSLVELALILPMLLLLVVAALDFGRIYLGYINVQNMARIAANEAANHPEAWSITPDTEVQARYRNEILEDSSASNCALPLTAGGDEIIPDPIFTDRNADGTAVGLGDQVTVRLTCYFAVATPLIANILGNQVEVTAESDFPVKAGMTAVVAEGAGGGGGGGGVTAPPIAGFVANSSVFASVDLVGDLTVTGPDVAVDFRDASGGGPATEWAWTVSDGTSYTSQDMVHTFHCPSPDPSTNQCEFWVLFTPSSVYGSSAPATMYVHVVGETDINFSANQQVIDRGQTVTFTNLSTSGGTSFAWDFGDGATVSGPDELVTHTYSTVGTYSVSLTVTYPTPPPGGDSVTKAAYITVNAGYCPVPSLTDVRFNDADDIWHGSPYNFLGHVYRANGANNSNFKIKSQSIAGGAGATAPCTSNIYVSDLAGYFTP